MCHDRPSERCGDVSQRLELVLDRLALIGGLALTDRLGGAAQTIASVTVVTTVESQLAATVSEGDL